MSVMLWWEHISRKYIYWQWLLQKALKMAKSAQKKKNYSPKLNYFSKIILQKINMKGKEIQSFNLCANIKCCTATGFRREIAPLPCSNASQEEVLCSFFFFFFLNFFAKKAVIKKLIKKIIIKNRRVGKEKLVAKKIIKNKNSPRI